MGGLAFVTALFSGPWLIGVLYGAMVGKRGRA